MSDDIMLNDLLHLTDEEIRRTKIRCCTEYNRYNPAEEFKKDPDMLILNGSCPARRTRTGGARSTCTGDGT